MITLDENYWNKFSQKMNQNQTNKNSEIENSEIENLVKGYAQDLTQGAAFGQAPHLAGVNNELANLPKKVYRAKTWEDIGRLYKDLGKDYVRAREQFKKENKEFDEEHPYTSLGANIVGGALTGGVLSSIGKSVLKSAIPRAMAEGGVYGLGYGASNTEGKAFDPVGSAMGTIGGVVGGAALGGLGNLAKKMFLSKNTGKVGEMITPAGIHEDTINNIVTDPKVAEAVANGNIGKKVGTYSNVVADSLTNLKNTVSNLKTQAYDGISGETKINLDKTIDDITKKIKGVKKTLGSDTKSKNIVKEADAILQDIKKTAKKRNEIDLSALKNYKDRIYRLQESAFETLPTGKQKRLVSQEVVDMLDNAYSSLSGAEKKHSPQLKFANEFYSDMSKAEKELADVKLYDEDTIAKSAARLGNETSGNTFRLAEKKVKDILSKYDSTKGLSDELFTNMKKLQVAKNIKPDSNYGVLQTPIKMAKNILTGGNREQKMQSFAQAVKDGKITKAMLDQEINKGKIAVAPFIDYYLALSKVPQANLGSALVNKVLPKNTNQILERYVLPRLTIRNILDRYYNKEQ